MAATAAGTVAAETAPSDPQPPDVLTPLEKATQYCTAQLSGSGASSSQVQQCVNAYLSGGVGAANNVVNGILDLLGGLGGGGGSGGGGSGAVAAAPAAAAVAAAAASWCSAPAPAEPPTHHTSRTIRPDDGPDRHSVGSFAGMCSLRARCARVAFQGEAAPATPVSRH